MQGRRGGGGKYSLMCAASKVMASEGFWSEKGIDFD